jgi:hypothetical protein
MRRHRRYYRSNLDTPSRGGGTPARWAMIALLILAGLIVIASIVS